MRNAYYLPGERAAYGGYVKAQAAIATHAMSP